MPIKAWSLTFDVEVCEAEGTQGEESVHLQSRARHQGWVRSDKAEVEQANECALTV